MKLYFGNAVTTATTLMILALLGYISFSVWNRGNIACWGRRTLLLLVFGLVVCCFAAARDGLDKTIQHTIDGSCAPGVFPLVSVPTVVGCAGALLIVVAAIATPIAGTQKMRELWFYVMSGGAVLKIVGGETDNLSFGAEGVPLAPEEEQAYLRTQVDSPDHVQYLARVDGELIGTASLNRKPGRMRHRGVFGISLKRAWWGCGAASALTEAVLAFARENGFAQLDIEVRSDNVRAIRLYEKFGFRKLCTFPAFFRIGGQDIDFDVMLLQLPQI